LYAISKQNPDYLLETDDDNIPKHSFLSQRKLKHKIDVYKSSRWLNAYSLFTKSKIWPRGLPLQYINSSEKPSCEGKNVSAYIQQSLADNNPDVDSIYRLTSKLPFTFDNKSPIALAPYTWCPFNSQATVFFKEAFPLLYLPSNCSFRMTDIWRSFVAQRCLWEMNGVLLFEKAHVTQDRNTHNIMQDFEDEIPGFMHNDHIIEYLSQVELSQGIEMRTVSENLYLCYEQLVEKNIFPKEELKLVKYWIQDLKL
jgi:hypothetical protein